MPVEQVASDDPRCPGPDGSDIIVRPPVPPESASYAQPSVADLVEFTTEIAFTRSDGKVSWFYGEITADRAKLEMRVIPRGAPSSGSTKTRFTDDFVITLRPAAFDVSFDALCRGVVNAGACVRAVAEARDSPNSEVLWRLHEHVCCLERCSAWVTDYGLETSETGSAPNSALMPKSLLKTYRRECTASKDDDDVTPLIVKPGEDSASSAPWLAIVQTLEQLLRWLNRVDSRGSEEFERVSGFLVTEQRIPMLTQWRDDVVEQLGLARPTAGLKPEHLPAAALGLQAGESAGVLATGIPTMDLARSLKGGFTLFTGTQVDSRPLAAVPEIPFALLPKLAKAMLSTGGNVDAAAALPLIASAQKMTGILFGLLVQAQALRSREDGQTNGVKHMFDFVTATSPANAVAALEKAALAAKPAGFQTDAKGPGDGAGYSAFERSRAPRFFNAEFRRHGDRASSGSFDWERQASRSRSRSRGRDRSRSGGRARSRSRSEPQTGHPPGRQRSPSPIRGNISRGEPGAADSRQRLRRLLCDIPSKVEAKVASEFVRKVAVHLPSLAPLVKSLSGNPESAELAALMRRLNAGDLGAVADRVSAGNIAAFYDDPGPATLLELAFDMATPATGTGQDSDTGREDKSARTLVSSLVRREGQKGKYPFARRFPVHLACSLEDHVGTRVKVADFNTEMAKQHPEMEKACALLLSTGAEQTGDPLTSTLLLISDAELESGAARMSEDAMALYAEAAQHILTLKRMIADKMIMDAERDNRAQIEDSTAMMLVDAICQLRFQGCFNKTPSSSVSQPPDVAKMLELARSFEGEQVPPQSEPSRRLKFMKIAFQMIGAASKRLWGSRLTDFLLLVHSKADDLVGEGRDMDQVETQFVSPALATVFGAATKAMNSVATPDFSGLLDLTPGLSIYINRSKASEELARKIARARLDHPELEPQTPVRGKRKLQEAEDADAEVDTFEYRAKLGKRDRGRDRRSKGAGRKGAGKGAGRGGGRGQQAGQANPTQKGGGGRGSGQRDNGGAQGRAEQQSEGSDREQTSLSTAINAARGPAAFRGIPASDIPYSELLAYCPEVFRGYCPFSILSSNGCRYAETCTMGSHGTFPETHPDSTSVKRHVRQQFAAAASR